PRAARPRAARRRRRHRATPQPRRTSSPMRSSQEFPETPLELAARVVETAHHRPLGTLENLADLRVGEPLQLAQKYDRSVIGGQILDGRAHPAGVLGIARPREGLVRVGAFGGTGRRGVLFGVDADVRYLVSTT